MQAAIAQSMLDGQALLTEHAGYMDIEIVRNSVDLAEHRRVRTLIESAIQTSGRGRIILRSTHGQRASDEVRAAIMHWLTTSPVLQRIALIVPTEALATELNLKGTMAKRELRAFTTIHTAEAWLLS